MLSARIVCAFSILPFLQAEVVTLSGWPATPGSVSALQYLPVWPARLCLLLKSACDKDEVRHVNASMTHMHNHCMRGASQAFAFASWLVHYAIPISTSLGSLWVPTSYAISLFTQPPDPCVHYV